MSEHTPGPLVRFGTNGIHKEVSKHYAHCIATTEGENRETNADLLKAAYNSYDKHCADPVAAAESDFLGEVLAIMDSIDQLGELEITQEWIDAKASRLFGIMQSARKVLKKRKKNDE